MTRRQATPWALLIPFALAWLLVWLCGQRERKYTVSGEDAI